MPSVGRRNHSHNPVLEGILSAIRQKNLVNKISASTPVPRVPRRVVNETDPALPDLGQGDQLWRAQLLGDRRAVRRLGAQLLGSLDALSDAEYTARCLGAVACAHADSARVDVFGDLIEWSNNVERQIPLIRLELPDFGTGHRVAITDAVHRLISSTENLRLTVNTHIEGGWTEPGSLVRTICETGDLHLAHEIARLMTAHGDAAAGENCRAAIIRRQDTNEALTLTGELYEKNRNDYVCNTRAAVLMDAFHRTGEKSYRDAALEVAWQSLLLTVISPRRSSFTFATTSRVIRAVDSDIASQVMELAIAADRLHRHARNECSGSCSPYRCLCRCDIKELWFIMAQLVVRLGRQDIALIITNRIDPNHVAVPYTLKSIVNAAVQDHDEEPF